MHASLPRSPSLLERPAASSLTPAECRRVMAASGAEQVFDFDKWAEHRSVWKYAQQVASLPFSHTLRSIALPLAWIVLVTVAVGLNFHAAEAGLLPRWAILPRDTAPLSQPLTLTSFALSLLLVFRTNASYGRFAEARQLWGLLLNRSRDLSRQAVAFLPARAWDAKATCARWTLVFSKALLCHLRANSSLQHEAAGVLCRAELQLLLAAEHPAVLTLQVLSELIEAAPITEMQRWQMHANLTALHDVLGGCERILRTPIPVAYTRHTSRFVILWMTALPLALWPACGWATLAAAPLVGVLLLGINEIGIDVEEPFSLLPLEAIADRAARDVKQTLDMQVMVMDRLMEARDGAINAHVFAAVTHERATALTAHADLLPLERRRRKHMADGIVHAPAHGSGDASPGPPVDANIGSGQPSSASVRAMYFGRRGEVLDGGEGGLISAAPSADAPPASAALAAASQAADSVNVLLSGA